MRLYPIYLALLLSWTRWDGITTVFGWKIFSRRRATWWYFSVCTSLGLSLCCTPSPFQGDHQIFKSPLLSCHRSTSKTDDSLNTIAFELDRLCYWLPHLVCNIDLVNYQGVFERRLRSMHPRFATEFDVHLFDNPIVGGYKLDLEISPRFQDSCQWVN